MLKRVKFAEYQILKSIHTVTIIVASDTEAFILIQK